jgi:hypothetical protein
MPDWPQIAADCFSDLNKRLLENLAKTGLLRRQGFETLKSATG